MLITKPDKILQKKKKERKERKEKKLQTNITDEHRRENLKQHTN